MIRRTRACRGCGVDIPQHRFFRYCEACREAPTCGSCAGRMGRHTPRCRAGVCRGCGDRLPVADKAFRNAAYCTTCRPVPHFDLVTADVVAALFTAHYRRAVGYAQRRGPLNRPEAEDIVATVFLDLWRKRQRLSRVTPGFLYRCVETELLHVHRGVWDRSAWARRTRAMDPQDLVVAERAAYDPTHPAVPVPL